MNNDENVYDIPSDIFSKSIVDILLMNSYNNVSDISKLLDDNGYYGRHRIKLAIDKKHSYDNYVFNIYMPDSVFNYSWPYKSSFNVKEKRVISFKGNKYYNHQFTGLMYHLFSKNITVNSLELLEMHRIAVDTRISLQSVLPMITTMFKDSLIKNGKVLLKSDLDILELFENRYSYKNKILTS